MSSEVLILSQEKYLGYYSGPDNADVVDWYCGPFYHSLVLSCTIDNVVYEGSVALSNIDDNIYKVFMNEEEYDEYYKNDEWDIKTECWKWQFVDRVEKPFFDKLEDELRADCRSGDKHSKRILAEYLADVKPELDFDRFYYYVMSCGNPDT